MAQQSMPNFTDGMTVHDTDLNPLVNNITDHETRLSAAESGKAAKTVTVTGASGLQGGGDLSANRTITPKYGNAANTVAQGNDSRIDNGQTAYTTTTSSTIGNSALSAKIGTGVGTNDANGSTTAGTVGAQLAYLRANSGGGGSGGFAPQSVTLTQSSTQSIPMEANTVVRNWQVSGSQNGTLFTAGNNYLVIPADGFYLFAGALVVQYKTSGTTVLYFNVESTTGNNDFGPASDGHNVLGSTYVSPVTGGGVASSSVPIPLTAGAALTAGQKVSMVCWSGSVARNTISNYGGQTVFSAVRLA